MPSPNVNPFTNMSVRPTSGLSFPWTELQPDPRYGSFQAAFGPQGVSLDMRIGIRWQDLGVALQQFLGYSYRDTSTLTPAGTPWLRRKLPWQHPYSNQLWVQGVTSVQGWILQGTQTVFDLTGGLVGADWPGNSGPWSLFEYASLILHFWRPPYYVRTDADVLDANGNPQEWLRYVDKQWAVSSELLTREGNFFVYSPGQGGPSGNQIPGAVGQTVVHSQVTRRWYQIPEQGLFSTASDQTPSGKPTRHMETYYDQTNPITGYVYPKGSPLQNCLNAPIGGGQTPSPGGPSNPPFIADNDPKLRLFGENMGLLRFVSPEYIPQPLQLPPALMAIPFFANLEAVSQVQYDVVFQFSRFSPPPGPKVPKEFLGHNLLPFAGDGLWYAAQSQQNAGGTPTGQPTTPFQYCDLSSLFLLV